MKEIKKIFFMIVGLLFIILGIAGILLPVIPGLPFFFMGIIFMARSSRKFMKLVFTNKYFGKYIKKFRKVGMDERIRNITLITIWTSHVIAIVILKVFALKITMAVLLLVMTWMLLTIKTYKTPEKVVV